MAYITVTEAAERKGCSRTAVYKAIKTGRLVQEPDSSIDEDQRYLQVRAKGGSRRQKKNNYVSNKIKEYPGDGRLPIIFKHQGDFVEIPICYARSPVGTLLRIYTWDLLDSLKLKGKEKKKATDAVFTIFEKYTTPDQDISKITSRWLSCKHE